MNWNGWMSLEFSKTWIEKQQTIKYRWWRSSIIMNDDFLYWRFYVPPELRDLMLWLVDRRNDTARFSFNLIRAMVRSFRLGLILTMPICWIFSDQIHYSERQKRTYFFLVQNSSIKITLNLLNLKVRVTVSLNKRNVFFLFFGIFSRVWCTGEF